MPRRCLRRRAGLGCGSGRCAVCEMANELQQYDFKIPRGLLTVANVERLRDRLIQVTRKCFRPNEEECAIECNLHCLVSEAGYGYKDLPWNEALKTNNPIQYVYFEVTAHGGGQEDGTISVELGLERWESTGIAIKATDRDLLSETAKEIRAYANEPTPGVLWHYTSWSGLKGIIEQNVMWASSAAYLNDTMELTHAMEFIRRVASEGGHQILVDLLSERYPYIAPERWFVASLSAKPDDLGQWRGYSETDSRFAIGFDKAALTKLAPEWRLVECVYRDADKEALIQQTMSDLSKSREAGNHDRLKGYNEAQRRSIYVLAGLACQMKDICFEQEAEQRLVKEVGREDLSTGVHLPKERYRFRQSKSLAIPFLEIALGTKAQGSRNADHPIREVIVGPGTDEQKVLNRGTASKLLIANGLYAVRVLTSKVPFRSY
jgi:hypothetical protein